MAFLGRLAAPSLARTLFVRAMTTGAGATGAGAPQLSVAAAATKVPNRPVVPSPRGSFNTPAVFLTTIGRGCEKYADKFTDWRHLFSASSDTMKTELGIGPKQRKWILMWKNKFRLGIDPYLIPPSKKHSMKRVERIARIKRRRSNK